MTMKPVETTDKDAPLRNDIRQLGMLLGDTLKRFGGARLFETEEAVRALCKDLRAAHATPQAAKLEKQLKRLLHGLSLSDAIGATIVVSKCFVPPFFAVFLYMQQNFSFQCKMCFF